MEHSDVGVRSDATEQMAAYTPAKVLPLLRRLAWEHPDLKTRREAVETMGEVRGTTALQLLDEIVERHPDDAVAAQAVETISGFPDSLSVPRLRRLAEKSPRQAVRCARQPANPPYTAASTVISGTRPAGGRPVRRKLTTGAARPLTSPAVG